MPRISQLETGSRNMSAFLDLIGFSELGAAILKGSDDGYNVIVGSTPAKIVTFDSYARHPNVVVALPKLGIKSSAAGRYQILNRYAVAYMAQLRLPNFSPESQDRIAMQLIRECKAVGYITQGNIAKAITMCNSRWASFPGAGYGQNEHKMEHLLAFYVAAGGVLAKGL